MLKTIIAAKGKNNVIGKNGSMPWYLPEDFKFFKTKTIGHYLLMGRVTYESLKVELEGRKIIILTGNRAYQAENIVIAHNLQNSFQIARENGENELFIAGGESIYKQTIELVDKIYLTEIDHSFNGDRFFPEFNSKEWKINKLKEYEQNDGRPYSFSIFEYIRK